MKCKKGCIDMGRILYNVCRDDINTDTISEIENDKQNELCTLDCYNEIYQNDYGHINYALASYCAEKGHLECLEHLHEDKDIELLWYNDLAIVAFENGNFECLLYIVKVMGDVKTTLEMVPYL